MNNCELPFNGLSQALPNLTKHTGWCYTLHDYTEQDVEELQNYDCVYHTFGYEVCPQTMRPHLQGYIEFKSQKMFRTLKNQLNTNIHWGTRRKCPKACATYCQKTGNFWERGVLPVKSQGARTDLQNMADYLKAGGSLRDAAMDHPETFIKFHKGVERFYDLIYSIPRETKPTIYWLYGPTGCGKTRNAYDLFKPDVYIKDGTQWWNNYYHQKAIIIDDFDGRWPFRDLLRLCDYYPYQGQSKGSYLNITSKYIFITCDKPPHMMFDDLGEYEKSQFLRRIDHVVYRVNQRLERVLTHSGEEIIIQSTIPNLNTASDGNIDTWLRMSGINPGGPINPSTPPGPSGPFQSTNPYKPGYIPDEAHDY